jgi:hypothetical protein
MGGWEALASAGNSTAAVAPVYCVGTRAPAFALDGLGACSGGGMPSCQLAWQRYWQSTWLAFGCTGSTLMRGCFAGLLHCVRMRNPDQRRPPSHSFSRARELEKSIFASASFTHARVRVDQTYSVFELPEFVNNRTCLSSGLLKKLEKSLATVSAASGSRHG